MRYMCSVMLMPFEFPGHSRGETLPGKLMVLAYSISFQIFIGAFKKKMVELKAGC